MGTLVAWYIGTMYAVMYVVALYHILVTCQYHFRCIVNYFQYEHTGLVVE